MSDHFAPRYLARFACIAGACEQSCCQGWRITVDEKHYHKLKQAMDGSRPERTRFREAHQRQRGPKASPHSYAFLVLADDGDCPMLDEDRLCAAQRSYGEEVLSHTCAVYPRAISAAGERIEAAASLSCPEIARQCLLHEDAMELDTLDPNKLPRLYVTQARPEGAYGERLDDIRTLELALLSQRQFPMSSRLFFIAWFAERSGFARDHCDRARLDKALSDASRGDYLAEWHGHLAAAEAPAPLAHRLILELLAGHAADLPEGGLKETLASVLESYLGEGVSGEGTRFTIDPTRVWAAYEKRRAALSPHQERVDLYFENYAKNYFVKEWYTRAPSLFANVEALLLRVAILRFLLLSHPRSASDLDATAVEVFSRFSRGIEHSPPFVERMAKALSGHALAHSVFLLKV